MEYHKHSYTVTYVHFRVGFTRKSETNGVSVITVKEAKVTHNSMEITWVVVEVVGSSWLNV